ncbi:MATE family efflux transporter [Chakrabartyella piscis]|uniref:MATE family efflux transporter n=1 Tax=Chakrabartyella piscis TaxID=2918914 RepID=UPI0029586324|nr:MATE family efflux transporter [Chakrabartyella piscis]
MDISNKKQDLFENQPISKSVWTLALPTIASMMVMLFYNLADTFFVGQTGDAMQVAAVSLTMPIFMLFIALGNLFGIGGSSAISRYLGAKRTDDIKHVSSFCFYGALGAGLLIGVLGLIFMETVVLLTGATEATYAYVYEYLTYLAFGAPFIVLANAYGNVVRSVGLVKEAMIGMMIGTIVNIVLDPIMILTLDMGVIGAAVATVIGNVIASIYYVILLQKGKSVLSIQPKDFTLQGKIVSDVFKIGTPASLNNLLMSIASLIYNVFLSGYGDIPVAAMGIALKANMLLIMLYLGLTMGAQPLIGYNYGAGNYTRMKQVIKYIITVALSMGVVIASIYFVTAETIVSVFINDAEVIAYGTIMLRAQAVSGCLLGIMFVSMSTLQSMGKAMASLVLSVSRQGLLFIPTIFIVNYLFGLDGLIWAQPVADCISIVVAIILLTVTLKQTQEIAIER